MLHHWQMTPRRQAGQAWRALNPRGAGSKLPHNLASLLGVMDGAASDLRTGLPWQMVEIHEPVRSLFLIETTPEEMLGIMDRNEGIGRLCRNGWVRLAVLRPETRAIDVFEDGEFRPYHPRSSALPKVGSSVEWYSGWRDRSRHCRATIDRCRRRLPAAAANGRWAARRSIR
jgi:hypothetical protein